MRVGSEHWIRRKGHDEIVPLVGTLTHMYTTVVQPHPHMEFKQDDLRRLLPSRTGKQERKTIKGNWVLADRPAGVYAAASGTSLVVLGAPPRAACGGGGGLVGGGPAAVRWQFRTLAACFPCCPALARALRSTAAPPCVQAPLPVQQAQDAPMAGASGSGTVVWQQVPRAAVSTDRDACFPCCPALARALRAALIDGRAA
eukprot:6830780-Prymnesium_polylepis.2